jgi:hypothetical protein
MGLTISPSVRFGNLQPSALPISGGTDGGVADGTPSHPSDRRGECRGQANEVGLSTPSRAGLQHRVSVGCRHRSHKSGLSTEPDQNCRRLLRCALARSNSVPKLMLPVYEKIVGLTDDVYDRHLNSEYRALARAMTGALCRKRPSPLASGQPRTWACGILYVRGRINFLGDPSLFSAHDDCGNCVPLSKSARALSTLRRAPLKKRLGPIRSIRSGRSRAWPGRIRWCGWQR